MSPESPMDLNQQNEQATLLVSLVLSTDAVTSCSIIPEMQKENVMEHHHN
jgi:hypothetical protein